MQHSEQVIVKLWIPILKEYERTKSKVNPPPLVITPPADV